MSEKIVNIEDSEDAYQLAHLRVRKERGKASTYICSNEGCEKQAKHWALRVELHVPGERRWSADINDYDPLCVSCHYWQDGRIEGTRKATVSRENHRQSDPEFAEKLHEVSVENGKKRAAAIKARRESDIEYAEQLAINHREGSMKAAATKKQKSEVDAEYAERILEGRKKASAAAKQRLDQNPELDKARREAVSRAVSIANKKRVQCSDCGMITSPAPMGRHRKASGHDGPVMQIPTEGCSE